MSGAADYCFGEAKFGGNAQAITRKRWLHHTTFLWDFQPSHMGLLKHPANAPAYREVPRTSLFKLPAIACSGCHSLLCIKYCLIL